MKKRNGIKKEVKRNKKTEDLMVNKRRNQSEPDLWKEIRLNLKPLGKAYNKFREKRRIAKQKEEERRLKEEGKQRLREEEAQRLQEQEERRFKKQKKIKEEKERRLKEQEKQRLEEKRIKERRLKEQEKQRLEEKRIKDEREEQIRKEQIYRARLIKGEEERIKQLKRVNELREEERKLIEERNLKFDSSFVEEQIIKDEEQQILKEEKQRLKKEEQRLKEEAIRLKEEEQRLKEVEQRSKEVEKISLKEVRKLDDKQKTKRLNGTVKWFNGAKGYGFIKREDDEKDIFVHFSAVKNSDLKYLKEGEQLTFEVEYSNKGPSAINLEKMVDEVPRSHLKVVK